MSNVRMPVPATALDHESAIVAAVELSARSWLVGAQVAGVPRQCRQKLVPSAEALLDHLDHLRQRAEKAGKRVERIVVAHEAGRDGFWLARWLIGRGIEAYVIQPSSVPADRRARRAKTDALDVWRCCCARPWRGCGGSRGCARWCRSRARLRRTAAGLRASGRT